MDDAPQQPPQCADDLNEWTRVLAVDPGHSARYAERFRRMAREGQDLDGEARLMDTLAPRNARILDAGCGPGRVAGRLHTLGHHAIGVDLDPALIAAAKVDHPGPRYLVGDLAELDLPARGISSPMDLIVCAGNVMTFLAPSTRVEVLRRLAQHLDLQGRAAIGFGAGRGYEFGAFRADAASAGFVEELLLSTWDLRPFTAHSDFLVAVLRRG
ncbi:bifunctional 2-polyprenyl-6-hydroxyphenol methylase/3-demethylubiquinol 3-O-methyltransferase UbiG [Brachybacterium sp. UMB0905]|uniref:class I SAM-dependent methyltransferase n=1 Tax=Brachybacterium sp. UMB0905 TaxID=2069310 RepID=UPI000C80EAA0|nr:class I SAM-dependent methyltransferase [Brachybacterium sp. UMB0905]PMC74721.1 SAM-dependent methyltransferase [Brachybacterium sp. UMB0905]